MENLTARERYRDRRCATGARQGPPKPIAPLSQDDEILDARCEADLIARWRKNRDQAAGARLVHSYQRLIRKMARRYRGFEVSVPDLIAEGNVGLLQALERFDPSRGFRLSTYAIWWIRAAMSEAVMNAPLVKTATSEAAKRLFFNLRRARSKFGECGCGDLLPESVAAIAKDLAVSEAEVIRMNRWLNGRDISLNAPVGRNPSAGVELQDCLTDALQDDEARIIGKDEREKQRALVREVLATLSEREQYIVTERWLKDETRTLADIAEEYGLTRERVRQIEAHALAKIKQRARNARLMTGTAASGRA